jgi:hypothetical protein
MTGPDTFAISSLILAKFGLPIERLCERAGVVRRTHGSRATSSIKELARRGSAGKAAPIRLELARPPMDRALLRRHFECPIVFGAAYNAMAFNRAALDLPFVTADGGAFANVLGGLEKRVTRGEGFSALVGELRVAIARQLSEGRRPGIAVRASRSSSRG